MFSQRVRKVWSSHVPEVGDRGKEMVLFLGIGSPFVNPSVCPPDQHLDSQLEEASSQWSASILLDGVPPLAGRARWAPEAATGGFPQLQCKGGGKGKGAFREAR